MRSARSWISELIVASLTVFQFDHLLSLVDACVFAGKISALRTQRRHTSPMDTVSTWRSHRLVLPNFYYHSYIATVPTNKRIQTLGVGKLCRRRRRRRRRHQEYRHQKRESRSRDNITGSRGQTALFKADERRLTLQWGSNTRIDNSKRTFHPLWPALSISLIVATTTGSVAATFSGSLPCLDGSLTVVIKPTRVPHNDNICLLTVPSTMERGATDWAFHSRYIYLCLYRYIYMYVYYVTCIYLHGLLIARCQSVSSFRWIGERVVCLSRCGSCLVFTGCPRHQHGRVRGR